MSRFDFSCQESPRRDLRFGVVDGRPAITVVTNEESWGACVCNPSGKCIRFIALDHCSHIVKKGTTSDLESLCDGLLEVKDEQLCLLELKEKREGYIPKAVCQLENTIRLMREEGLLDGSGRFARCRDRRAYVCNRRKRKVKTPTNEHRERIAKASKGFRLHLGWEISL